MKEDINGLARELELQAVRTTKAFRMIKEAMSNPDNEKIQKGALELLSALSKEESNNINMSKLYLKLKRSLKK